EISRSGAFSTLAIRKVLNLVTDCRTGHRERAARDDRAALYVSVIARSEATKQSSFLCCSKAGLLRFARNDAAYRNLEMPDLVLAHHPGITLRVTSAGSRPPCPG